MSAESQNHIVSIQRWHTVEMNVNLNLLSVYCLQQKSSQLHSECHILTGMNNKKNYQKSSEQSSV